MEKMTEIAKRLCQGLSGSRCNVPRLSSWTLIDPAQAGIGVDAVDVGTLGFGSPVPVNVKIYGSMFSTGLYREGEGGLCAGLKGYGGGSGVSAGLNTPGLATRFVGKIPAGFKREVLKRIAGVIDGQLFKAGTDMVWTGESGGTCLVTGPDATYELSTLTFHKSFATIIGLSGNFGPNGVSAGLVIFSKQKPVISFGDMIYATAFGLMVGVGLATSIDIEVTGQSFRCSII